MAGNQESYNITLNDDLFVDPTFEKVKRFDGYFPVKHETIKDGKFDKLSTSSCKLLVRLLSICYKHSSSNVQVNVHDLPTFRRVNVQDLFSELSDFKYLALTELKKESNKKNKIEGIEQGELIADLILEDQHQELINLWNAQSDLSKIIKLSNPRKSKLKKRFSEPLFDFKKAIPLILESDFLMGRSSGWKITFDWFIENESNYIKVLEGNYSNKGPRNPSPNDPISHAKSQMQRMLKDDNEQA